MKKYLFILASFLLVGGLARAVVLATPAPKYFVCKYVGKPGVDERLQTGNNPISVSENAIANFQGVGSYFNDAQGRSLVVAVDIGQDEPTCPVPETPPVTPKDETPPTNTPPTTPKAQVTTPSANVTVELPEVSIGIGK